MRPVGSMLVGFESSDLVRSRNSAELLARPGSPLAYKFFAVHHRLGCQRANQTQQSSNLFPGRVSLLVGQNDTRMLADSRCPLRVDLVVVPDIERV